MAAAGAGGRDQMQQILKPHQQRLTVDLSPFLEPFPGLSDTSLPLGCPLLDLLCCFHSEIVASGGLVLTLLLLSAL